MAVPTPSADQTAETDAIRHQRLHEAITMALYVSISLQAVVLATPILDADQARVRVALTVFLTAVGLLLAHQLAFRMSSRLLNRGELDESSLAVLSAQGLGGLPVAVVAALPILVVGGRAGIWVSELLLLAIVTGVGYAVARSSGKSRFRSGLYVGGLAVVVGGILGLKLALGH